MKKYVKGIALASLFVVCYGGINAQSKMAKSKKAKTSAETKTVAVSFTPKEFGSINMAADVSDVQEMSPAYQSLKNLIETNGVTLVYADSTFRPKDPLRRGDFIVSLNSALDAVKKTADAGGLDSAVTSSGEPGDITQAAEIKDVKESSVYYAAVQSLIEQHKTAAPFAKAKMLNAGATMTEAEVYDILKTTFGYSSPGENPYASAMTRLKFATVLDNALNFKLSQVNELVSARQASMDDVKKAQEMMVMQQDKQMKDSTAKQAELSRIDALKKEAEAWSKLSNGEKRKQLKKQGSK